MKGDEFGDECKYRHDLEAEIGKLVELLVRV